LLPRQHRINSGSDFKVIMRTGKRANATTITAYAASATSSHARFGFVVSKSVGSAVTRNLVKRRLRALAAKTLSRRNELDVIIRANPAAALAKFDELASDFERVISQVYA
jgi:ribonuclease P protein component